MKDLFGNEISVEEASAFKGKQIPKGYAAHPGSGPRGETCGTCEHAKRVAGGNKHFWKCALLFRVWTHSYGTDIRLKAPACNKWELSKFSPFKTIRSNEPPRD